MGEWKKGEDKGDANFSKTCGLVKGSLPVVTSSPGIGTVEVEAKRGCSGRESTVGAVHCGAGTDRKP